MHSRYTGVRRRTNKKRKTNFIFNGFAWRSLILESAPIAIFCLITETTRKDRLTFRGIPGFYSTSQWCRDYTAVIFSAQRWSSWNARFSLLLVVGKCSYSPAWPATQRLTRSRPPTSSQSRTPVHCVAHAWRFKLTGVYSQQGTPLRITEVHSRFRALTSRLSLRRHVGSILRRRHLVTLVEP